MSDAVPTAPADASYDDRLRLVDDIIKRIESGSTPLEDLHGLVRTARGALDACQHTLDEVTRSVECALGEGGGGGGGAA